MIHTINSASAVYGNVFPFSSFSFLLFFLFSSPRLLFVFSAFLTGHSLHLMEASNVFLFFLLKHFLNSRSHGDDYDDCRTCLRCCMFPPPLFWSKIISAHIQPLQLCSISWAHTLNPLFWRSHLFTDFQATILPKESPWDEQMLRSWDLRSLFSLTHLRSQKKIENQYLPPLLPSSSFVSNRQYIYVCLKANIYWLQSESPPNTQHLHPPLLPPAMLLDWSKKSVWIHASWFLQGDAWIQTRNTHTRLSLSLWLTLLLVSTQPV